MDEKTRIIRWPEVAVLVSLSRPTIWRMEKMGSFPKRRMLGKNSVGWIEDEVMSWIDNRAKVGERVSV